MIIKTKRKLMSYLLIFLVDAEKDQGSNIKSSISQIFMKRVMDKSVIFV